MSAKSMLLKEEGNRHFQTGDYAGADGLYSKAYAAPSLPCLVSVPVRCCCPSRLAGVWHTTPPPSAA